VALRVDKVDDYFHQTFVQFLTSFINGANNGVSCASGKHECLYFFSCKQFLKTIDTVCLYLFSLRPFTRMGRDVRCRVRLSRDLWTSQKNVFCQYNRGGGKSPTLRRTRAQFIPCEWIPKWRERKKKSNANKPTFSFLLIYQLLYIMTNDSLRLFLVSPRHDFLVLE